MWMQKTYILDEFLNFRWKLMKGGGNCRVPLEMLQGRHKCDGCHAIPIEGSSH